MFSYTVFLRHNEDTGITEFLVDDASVRAGTKPPSLETASGSLVVGATVAFQSAANVLVHEVRIFDQALSDQEVVAVYQDMNP